MSELFKLKSIGIAKTEYNKLESCPSNGWESKNISKIVVHPQYISCLKGHSQNDIIHVLWWFHKARRDLFLDTPHNDKKEIGCFAMRTPNRPNPIALSLCKIIKIEGDDTLIIKGLECLNGSHIIDIKAAINYESIIL